MSFRNILIDCATEIGLSLNNLPDRNWLTVKINEAAEDLYTSDDLVGCLREQVFSLDVDNQQISLPWYVYKIRGARWKNIKLPIRLDDMRPRYATQGYTEMLWRGFTWRIKDNRSATERDITNAAPVTITVPLAEMVDVTINLTGQTANNTRITEAVVLPALTTSVVATNTFLRYDSITKNILTTNDIIVLDVNAVEIARIPNSELSSLYTIIQIVDFDQSNFINNGGTCVEILYKIKFTPFRNDYDEFPCGNIYDKAIFWKFMEHFKGKEGSIDLALAAKMKCNEVIGNLARENDNGEDQRIDLGHNRFLRAQDMGPTDIRYRRGYGNWYEYPSC